MASPDIDIQVDKRQLREVERMLVNIPRGFPKVVSRALNKVATSGRKIVVDRVQRELNITKRQLKLNITLRRATYRRLMAVIGIHGGRFPLSFFRGTRELKRGGITYKIGRQRKSIRDAFSATVHGGHKGFFVRQKVGGKAVGRLPIIELHGPSVPMVVSNIAEFARAVFEVKLAARAAKEIETQVGVLIEQEARKSG